MPSSQSKLKNPTWAPSARGSSPMLAGPLRPVVTAYTTGFLSAAAPTDADASIFFRILVDFRAVCFVLAMRNVCTSPTMKDLPAFVVESWPLLCFEV